MSRFAPNKPSKSPVRRRIQVIVASVIVGFVFAVVTTLGFAQPVGPAEQELEGTLEVVHEDRDVGSRYLYFLYTAAERLELRFAGEAPALQTGDHIRAKGIRSNGVLALSSGDGVQALSLALPNTFGAQKTLVILVNFADKNTQPYTVSSAQSVVNTTSNFDLENSFQQTALDGTVVGWYTIAQNSTVCDYNTTASLAEQAAAADGVDVSAYNRRVYAFPDNACTWWGLGTVGGNPSRAWVSGTFSLKVLGHEMGHGFGLYHSKSLSCDSSTCTASEYGDGWDIMGNPSSGHFNAFQKERLGWLNYNVSPPILSVDADGIYSIASYESQDLDPKALKILKSTDLTTGKSTYYYVEYRAKQGFDGSVSSAVILHTGSESSANSSNLWDLDQATTTADWILNVGQTYSDAAAGVNITLLSMGSTGASVSVTLDGGSSTTCVQANPTVTISPASQSVAVGSSATYTVTVTNYDNSGCTASAFSLGAAMPSELSASFASSSLSVAPASSVSTTLQVASSSSAPGGLYNFMVTGTNSTATSYSGSASGIETLIASVSVNVTTDKSVYSRKGLVTVKAVVSANGSPAASASVSFTIKNPKNATYSGTATSDGTGTAVYKYRLKQTDPVGSYGVTAVSAVSGLSGTGTTTFAVQ